MAVLLFCPCNTVHHLLFHYIVSIQGITIKAFNCFGGLPVVFVLSVLADLSSQALSSGRARERRQCP